MTVVDADSLSREISKITDYNPDWPSDMAEE